MTRGAEIMQNWFDAVWVARDPSAVDRFFAPTGQVDGLMTEMQLDAEEMKVMIAAMLELVTDLRFTMLRTAESGDMFAALMRLDCRSLAGGHAVAITGQIMIRFQEDKIIEAYNHFDFMGFWAQLGLLPEDAMALCMAGERVA